MTVSFDQIPANVNVPLFYAEMDASQANTAQTTGASLLIGQALPGAAIARNQLVLMPSAAQARTACGQGSPLARMVTAYRRTDPFGELYIIAVADAAAGSAATGKIAIAGTATSAGSISLYIGSTRIEGVVAADDTAMQAASSLVDAINADADLPVTSAAAANGDAATITITAKYTGVAGGNIPLTLNYYGTAGGEQTPDGLNIQITAMAGGAKNVDLDSVIAAMGDESFDFIGFPFSDSSSLKLIGQEMDDSAGRWSWYRQLYGHVYSAKIGPLTDLVGFGDSFNDQHLTICGYEPDTQTPPDELIAARLGRQAAFIRNDPARPTQTGAITGALPAPIGRRNQILERQSLLTHGIATAAVAGGTLQIERDVTTYKVNKFGATDNSYLDSETLHTSAYVLRKLKSVITTKYARHKLADDGTRFGQGQAIVTPSVLRGEICAAYRQLELAGIVENFEVFKKYLIVERNANKSNRVDVLFPPDYINQLRIFAVKNQFRLQYSDEEKNA